MAPRMTTAGALAGAIAALSAVALPATAVSPFVTEPKDAAKTRANRYAALEGERCLAVLDRRDISWKRAETTRGVDTPVRLAGPLRGVRFRPIEAILPDEQDDRTIADCRLVLALDDLARILRRYGVAEVEYYSMYRSRGAGSVQPGMRHQGARAIDFVGVTLRNGMKYAVRSHFRTGSGGCEGKGAAPAKENEGARFWREVVCEISGTRSFNLILTPNYDWAHRDHLHMEVRSGIGWFLIR